MQSPCHLFGTQNPELHLKVRLESRGPPVEKYGPITRGRFRKDFGRQATSGLFLSQSPISADREEILKSHPMKSHINRLQGVESHGNGSPNALGRCPGAVNRSGEGGVGHVDDLELAQSSADPLILPLKTREQPFGFQATENLGPALIKVQVRLPSKLNLLSPRCHRDSIGHYPDMTQAATKQGD